MKELSLTNLNSTTVKPVNSTPHVWVLLTIFILCLIASCLVRNDGGMNQDSIQYFNMADNLTRLRSNVFPVGYPIVVRIFYFFTQDYFWASKLVNVAALCSILILSYRKNFFFFETTILLCFKVGIGLFFFSYSEPLFIAILYYFIYFIHRYFEHSEEGMTFLILVPMLLFCLLLVRYTGIYIYLATGAFYIFKWLKEPFKRYERFFYMLLLSSGLIALYLVFNVYYFGSFFGENFRGVTEYRSFKSFFADNLFGILGVVNPIFTINLTHKEGFNFLLKMIPVIIDFMFLGSFIYVYAFSKTRLSKFQYFLLYVGVMFLCFLFYSSFKTNLETIGLRLVAPAAIVLVFGFLILVNSRYRQGRVFLVFGAYLSLTINLLYNIKSGGNYLQRRNSISEVIMKKKEAQYFVIDKEDPLVSNINIPLVNAKFSYKHVDQSSGDVNKRVLFALLPNLRELKSANGYNNEEVIFNSEIK